MLASHACERVIPGHLSDRWRRFKVKSSPRQCNDSRDQLPYGRARQGEDGDDEDGERRPRGRRACGRAGGLVNLRLGRFDAAIADYDAVLARHPRIPESLYGRGLAKRGKGDAAGAAADIAAARTAKADIAETFARFGVK